MNGDDVFIFESEKCILCANNDNCMKDCIVDCMINGIPKFKD